MTNAKLQKSILGMPVGGRLSLEDLEKKAALDIEGWLNLNFTGTDKPHPWRIQHSKTSTPDQRFTLTLVKVEWSLTSEQVDFLAPHRETLRLAHSGGEDEDAVFLAKRT